MSEYNICPKCGGDGIDEAPRSQSPPRLRWDHCKTCKGTGRLNWLELVFGKRKFTKEDRRLRGENTTKYLQSRGIAWTE